MSALATFTAKLNRMASPATWSRFKSEAAAVTKKSLLETYSNETDPYGAPWAHVADHPGHVQILHDTGALKGSFRINLISEGFKIRVTDRKATWHQHGTRRMVARPFLPARGLPPRIAARLRLLARKVFA